VLLQDTEPSWLTMVDRGATTVWEEWGGVDDAGAAHASLNHYSKGAVVSFLYRFVAGLQLVEPGYRRFRVAPRPGGGLRWAEASHHCPYGRIAARWDLGDGDAVTVGVTVPPSTEAEVVLPSGTTWTLGPGDHEVAD
jgi:alpha-L-rhamnosidase